MKQLVIDFGKGRAVPFFKGADVRDGRVIGRWAVVKLQQPQPIGTNVETFTKGDEVAEFEANNMELASMMETLNKMMEDPSKAYGINMATADSDTTVQFNFPEDSAMSIMILRSTIAQTIVAVDMIKQSTAQLDKFKAEIDDCKHALNKLRNANEYAKLKDDGEPYDKAIADLVKYRQIFPPDKFGWDELKMISKASKKAMALALVANLLGDDND